MIFKGQNINALVVFSDMPKKDITGLTNSTDREPLIVNTKRIVTNWKLDSMFHLCFNFFITQIEF